MKNTFKYLAVLAAFSFGMQAQGAVQNYTFNGVIDSGFYDGTSFSGNFSFDDATIDNVDFDIATLLSFDMSLLSTNFTLADVDGVPDLSFQDGSFLGLALNLNSVNPDIAFTFVPGSIDVSDAQFAYDTTLGLSGGANVAYAMTAPIPETETYAMLLAGLGVMGAVARRRKSV
jgi:hypothetical protein